MSSIFNTYIIGSQNVVATGSQISQNIYQEINEKDLMLDYMENIGIPEDEIKDLRKTIEEDGPRTESNKFGLKVAKWVGKVTKKALEGSYKIAVSTAPTLITEALL